MRKLTAIKRLMEWDRKGRDIFTMSDLKKIFHAESSDGLASSLARLRKDGILEKLARGIYHFSLSSCTDGLVLQRVAMALRPFDLNYLSYESALSHYGVISQIPVSTITVATTGRRGRFETSKGIIELTTVKRSVSVLVPELRDLGQPLPIASPALAFKDLSLSRRNLHLVDSAELNEAISEDGGSRPSSETNDSEELAHAFRL